MAKRKTITKKKTPKKLKKIPSTHIVIVLDESGSMGPQRVETIQGFNAFIEEQKKVKGNAYVTLVKFNTEINVLFDRKNIKDVEPLSEATYTPNCGTALNDAFAKGINLGDASKITERVLIMVMTDGQENASKEYKNEHIKKMVEERDKKKDWTFTFIGANIDSFAVGAGYGINPNNTVNYDSHNTKDAIRQLCASTTLYRTSFGPSGQSITKSDNFFGGKKKI